MNKKETEQKLNELLQIKLSIQKLESEQKEWQDKRNDAISNIRKIRSKYW